MEKKHCAAIVLAGGQGKRMGTKIQKQYLDISGKPLIYYSFSTYNAVLLIMEFYNDALIFCIFHF